MASITIRNISTDSFQARVTDMYTALYKTVTWYIDGSEWDYEELDTSDTSSSWITFSGLSSGTEYQVTVSIYYETGTTDEVTEYVTTEGQSGSEERPDYFYWDTSKVSGKTINITASEWCRLLNNINEVRVYKGYSKISSTSDSSAIARFYYPSKGEQILASMYNQCIYAFDNMGLLNYSDYRVSSGDIITADCINFLRDTINNVD